jgi:hypothetical protein
MNKLLSILLSLGIVLSLVACVPSTHLQDLQKDPANKATTPATEGFDEASEPDNPTEASSENVETHPTEATQPADATEPTEAPTDHTEAPIEPTQPDEPKTPEIEPESELLGYCAVGIVDAEAGTAKVLFDDSTIAEITYQSNFTPVPGKVYGYSLNEGVYTLHTVIWEFGQETPLTVRTFDNHDQGMPDQLFTHDGVTATYYELTEDTVVFARFSETEYRIFQGSDIIYYSDWPCICFFSTIPSQDGDGLEVTVILVCQMLWDTMTDGNADESTTYFFDPEGFGWADGDLIIE